MNAPSSRLGQDVDSLLNKFIYSGVQIGIMILDLFIALFIIFTGFEVILFLSKKVGRP